MALLCCAAHQEGDLISEWNRLRTELFCTPHSLVFKTSSCQVCCFVTRDVHHTAAHTHTPATSRPSLEPHRGCSRVVPSVPAAGREADARHCSLQGVKVCKKTHDFSSKSGCRAPPPLRRSGAGGASRRFASNTVTSTFQPSITICNGSIHNPTLSFAV